MHNFYTAVYDIVAQIPEGRVTSYGAIAKALGAAKSSRMVGYAMNLSHTHRPGLPAHRVVNRNGLLTGRHHFASPTQMQERLESEGVNVKKDQVMNFKLLFWDPLVEITL